MSLNSYIKNMFMTPDEQKRIDDEYYKKMFPFGEAQQKWEDDTINGLFPDRKNIPTIKYSCLVRREMYIDGTVNDDPDSDETKYYLKQLKRMKVNKEEQALIDAFARLENEADSIETLPTIEEIKLEAKK